MKESLKNIKKILVMGLSSSGKTTLSKELTKQLNAIYFNADEIRKNINKDLDFSLESRIEQARRLGWLADQVVKNGSYCVCDFICPTPECRNVFNQGGESFIIFLNTIKECKYQDTNKLFIPPESYHIKFDKWYKTEDMVKNIISSYM